MSGWPTLTQDADIGDDDASSLAENIGGQPDPTPARKSSARLRLDKVSDIKRELARLYREARREEISTQTATRLAYLLNMMAQLIETTELEKRVIELEKLGAGR